MRPGSWVLLPRGLLSLHEMPSLTVDGAVTAKETVVVRGNRREKEVWQVFVD